MKLIGLTGYAQHGKDSAADVLCAEFGYTRYAFADQLRAMALALNPYVYINDMDARAVMVTAGFWRLDVLIDHAGWNRAKKSEDVRAFLQRLGTEAVREHLGEDAWVEALERKIRIERPLRVVVTDVRFPNEAEWVKSLGGRLWRAQRWTEKGELWDNGIGTEHPSEKHIAKLPVDRNLNAVTLDELQNEVRLAVREERA